MTDPATQAEQDVTADAQSDTAEVVSDARAARKEAQTLVSNVADQAHQVASLVAGQSGLDAEAKADVLSRAHKAAQALRAEAEKVEAAIKRAVDAL